MLFHILVSLMANIYFLFSNSVQYDDYGRTAEVPAKEVSC